MILWKLFWEFFKTGLFAIGGGMATVPFLQDISAKTGWFTSADLANMIAVSESTPGPMGVNMATYVGYTVGSQQLGGTGMGVVGAVVATLGLISPSRTLCARKGITIIEAAALPDHIHLYVEIPPKYSVSEIVGYLKGKSSLMIFDRHANLKYKYGNRHFWCRGYYVDTVGRNEKTIKEYVRNKLQEDIASDQMCLKEFKDPFTGEPVVEGK